MAKRLYCNRCKKVLKPGEYTWVWNRLYCQQVPMCKDDRLCYEGARKVTPGRRPGRGYGHES